MRTKATKQRKINQDDEINNKEQGSIKQDDETIERRAKS